MDTYTKFVSCERDRFGNEHKQLTRNNNSFSIVLTFEDTQSTSECQILYRHATRLFLKGLQSISKTILKDFSTSVQTSPSSA